MKKEFFYVFLIAISVLLISNLSYYVPLLARNDGLIFLERHKINSEDVYTYVSTIEQVRQGRFLTENEYTSEPQVPSLLRPSYILIGNFAKAFGLSSLAAYHIFRILFSITFLFTLYQFLYLFFNKSEQRIYAYSIVLFSSGLGFLLSNWVPGSIDLWIPEAITFLSFSEAPHFILSLTLLLTGFYFFIKYLKTENLSLLLPMFFSFFVLSFEHPFDLVVVVPVLFLTSLWNKKSLVFSSFVAIFSGIGLTYQIYEAVGNPILKVWNAQNILLSPPPINYLVGFGLLVIFGLIGINIFMQELRVEQKFIITWVGVTTILIYFPFNFQRRLIEGIHIGLCMAAVYGIYKFIERYKEKNKKWILIGILVILSLSSLFSVYQDFQTYGNDPKDLPYYYIRPENIEAIRWIGTRTSFNDIILSNRFFGNLIPGVIGRKVFIGHAIQTINFSQKINMTNEFLLETDDKRAYSFLTKNHITYIFLGSNDSMIQYGFKPDEKTYLRKVYKNSGVSIYKVIY